jgi:hypothetical protein
MIRSFRHKGLQELFEEHRTGKIDKALHAPTRCGAALSRRDRVGKACPRLRPGIVDAPRPR